MTAESQRPVINVHKTGLDYFFEWGALLLIISMWIYAGCHYPQLPNTIPVHYGASGYADGFGSKTTLFILPGIVTAINILLRLVNRFPHKFNYLTNITPENAEMHYRKSMRLLRYLQFFISLLFSYIVFKEVNDASSQYSKLDVWFMFVFFPGLLIPTVYTIYTSLTSNKSKQKK